MNTNGGFFGGKGAVVCPAAVSINPFYRVLDYSLDFEHPVPPNPISIDQAGEEILDRTRNGLEGVPVTNDSRGLDKALY